MQNSQDAHDEENGGLKEALLVRRSPSKGGFWTLPFILAIDGVEKAIGCGLQPNMILYLMGSYGLEMATGSNILFWWSAATNFASIFGAFLADTYAGRFRMIAFGSFFSIMGMTLLWLTAMLPTARPSCNDKYITTETCSSPTPFQLIFLCSSFGLMSIGTGGIRSSTAAFGTDQISGKRGDDEDVTPMSDGAVGTFFNWFCFSMYFAIMFALTFLVYIQEHMGWKAGFGVPVMLMFVASVFFLSGSSLYVKSEPKSRLLTGFAQVLAASWRNRHFQLREQQSIEHHVARGSTLKSPSEKLRFLNKACMIKDSRQDLTMEGNEVDPWHLCTTDQVEEFKSVLNIIPIWSTGITLNIIPSLTSFQVLQAKAMDRHFLWPSFEIPAGSFSTFAFIIALIWLVLYDRVIIPLASKAKGKPVTISIQSRMGVGFLLPIMAMVAAAIVERARRNMATRGGKFQDYPPSTTVPMSAMWLVPQISLLGLAEAIGGVAQLELFYLELPKSMSSIASNLYGVSMGVASLGASLTMSLIDQITKRGGRQSWISGDVNKGHYDYYCWVLASISFLNYIYFLLCSRMYWRERKASHDTKETGGE